MKHGWQAKYLKIPSSISLKIKSFDSNDVIVACTKKIGKEEIISGTYSHIGIEFIEDKIKFKGKIIPNVRNGTRSRRNVLGHQYPIKEHGKIWKTYSMDTPNWGDWSKGSHEISWEREVYPQRKIPPRYLELTIELVHGGTGSEEYILKFAIDRVLNRQTENFEEELLFALNLLQENVGDADVFESDAKLQDFLRTTAVNWEILPPGEREENFAKILSGIQVTPKENREIRSKYEFLEDLNPKEIIKGTSGFHRYFGAKFDENLIVFENVHYGNALYVMYEDWEELSRRSRTELLSDPDAEYDRVIHSRNWKRNLLRILKSTRPDLFGRFNFR